MSTIAAPVTGGEFRNLLEQDVRAELIGGEVIEMARARKDHEIVKANANGVLFPYWQQSGIGKIFIETMCELTEADALVPDLALRVMEQIDVEEESFHGAPDLAVEVVSSEAAERLQHKVNLHLRHGAHLSG
jgi:Uma2 family endonuclease